MSCSNWVHLDVEEVVRVTDKAMLVTIDAEDYWLPLSHVSEAGQYEAGDRNVTVSIAEWLAEKHGLEGSD